MRSIEFERLLGIMNDLRAKCPWDQKQTLHSLSHLTIEEVYELYDAIREENLDHVKEEVADLMLHLVFYMKIISEKTGETVDDVLAKGNQKLIDRHPHVYATEQVLSEAEVKQNWEKLKLKEGRKSIFSGVPLSLPSIIKAYRIQDKAAQTGFDWTAYQEVRDKLTEETIEFDQAVAGGDQDKIEEELGDMLFTMVNLARFLKVDPEMALQKTNQKFIDRFQYMEQHAERPLQDLSIDAMEALWNQAKIHLPKM